MKAFALKLAYIILPFFFIITITNYIVDPANVFSAKKYVGGIADILSLGHNVDNISNYDERLLQEQMVSRLRKTPDIVVIGASRIMEVGSDFFPGKIVLNCGVSHANIHDVIAITELLDSFGRLPSKMIINLDPDLIGKGGSLEWQSLEVYHDAFLGRQTLGNKLEKKLLESNTLDKIYSFVSFEYFRQSVLFLFKGDSKKYYDVQYQQPTSNGRFADGTISYSYHYMHPDTFQVAVNARVTGYKTGIPYPDSGKIVLLNLLLDFLQKKHVTVEFLMLPFHPEYYTAVNMTQKNLFNVYDSLFRDLAGQRKIKIYGGFNAYEFGFKSSQFYDMYHSSKQAILTVGLK